jgi:gliding motility-associated-like protein
MKKYAFLLIFLFALNRDIQAQEFYICSVASANSTTSSLRKVQLPTCTSQLIGNFSRIYNDITFHPSGKLYGVAQEGGLYELDTLSARTQLVVTFGNGSRTDNFNSLTSNAEGVIYAAGENGKIYSYDPRTQSTVNLGLIKVNGLTIAAAGDLTFYRGDLYVASTRSLVKIDLTNPANSSTFMNFNVTAEIYGIVSFVDCGQVSTYATTGDNSGIVYKIDWTNRVLVRICQTNNIIYGGASRYEFRASSVSLDTTRLVSYTCNPSQAVVKPTRTLKNQLGCDSLIFERIDYVKPDTTRNIATTCDRSKARIDTARLQNTRGCDSIVITGIKFGVDSINLPLRQICSGDSVNFYNRWLRETGVYAKNFTKTSGCDSIISLQLRVFEKQTILKDSFVCQANQVKRDSILLRNIAGCDSLIIRNQLIAPRLAESRPLNANFCKGDTFRIGQNRFFTEGSFSATLKNIYGCDSTLNLTLKYLPTDSTIIRPETCDPTKLKDSIRVFKNRFGCDSSIIIRPKLLTNPNQINNLPKQVDLVIGDSVTLSPQFNFAPTFIQWTPSNLVNCGTCLNVISRVRTSTTLRLFAKDSKDCPAQQDIKFIVNPNRRVYLPNSFSPNNDTQNDVFTLYGDKNLHLIVSLKIFDRWGEMVYSGDNLKPNTEGWDGRFKGQVLSPDVFVYWAVLRFKDGEDVLFKGDLTLVR